MYIHFQWNKIPCYRARLRREFMSLCRALEMSSSTLSPCCAHDAVSAKLHSSVWWNAIAIKLGLTKPTSPFSSHIDSHQAKSKLLSLVILVIILQLNVNRTVDSEQRSTVIFDHDWSESKLLDSSCLLQHAIVDAISREDAISSLSAVADDDGIGCSFCSFFR